MAIPFPDPPLPAGRFTWGSQELISSSLAKASGQCEPREALGRYI